MSRRRHISIPPRTPFSRSRPLEFNLRTIDPLRHFSSSLELSSAGVAPLPPCSRKLLDETVKTLAVFPSWLHLLDGEDNCMLSVPLSTSDLHHSCWQSGENCQVVSQKRHISEVMSDRRAILFKCAFARLGFGTYSHPSDMYTQSSQNVTFRAERAMHFQHVFVHAGLPRSSVDRICSHGPCTATQSIRSKRVSKLLGNCALHGVSVRVVHSSPDKL